MNGILGYAIIFVEMKSLSSWRTKFPARSELTEAGFFVCRNFSSDSAKSLDNNLSYDTI